MIWPPRARQDLLATALDEEVVLYDPERHVAHTLNRIALAIWKHCDGFNTIYDLRRLAGADVGMAIDEKAVWKALYRLEAVHLLADRPSRSLSISRRQALGRAGHIGLIAVATPLIASALVPMAAAAASRPRGLPPCKHGSIETGCSSFNESCVCAMTTGGARVCINPSTALKKTTCKKESDCRPGYLCIPRGKAPPRCIAPCAVPTCTC